MAITQPGLPTLPNMPLPEFTPQNSPGLAQLQEMGPEALQFVQDELAKRLSSQDGTGGDPMMDDIVNKLLNNQSLNQEELDYIKEKSSGNNSTSPNTIPNAPTGDNTVGGGGDGGGGGGGCGK